MTDHTKTSSPPAVPEVRTPESWREDLMVIKDPNGTNYDREKSSVSLKTYLESLITESDKRSDAQFLAAKEAVAAALAAAEKAVAAALVAQDKQTSAAFAAAKEALAEAQVQLNLYKAQSNEWRATLTDLIAKVMMRVEVEATFNATNKTMNDMKQNLEDKLGGFEKRLSSVERASERLAGGVVATDKAEDSALSKKNQSTALTITIILFVIAAVIGLVEFIINQIQIHK